MVFKEFDFIIGGNSLADSLDFFHLHGCDSEDPIPGPSQGWDSMLGFLHQLMGVASSSPPLAAGSKSMRTANGVGSFRG